MILFIQWLHPLNDLSVKSAADVTQCSLFFFFFFFDPKIMIGF